MPRRPTFFRSECPAIPTTRTPKSSGAMITLMRRRKIVPRSCKLTATAGASWPSSAPARRPTKIQVVSERRETAYAAIKKIATHRSRTGTSAGSGKIWVPGGSVMTTAIMAAPAAATRNLFFIGTRRIFSSVPKGILVSDACQWGRLRVNTTAIPYAALGPLLHAQRFERIDAGGAAGGKVASQQGDAQQQQGNARVGDRIGGADPVEQIPGHARDGQGH